MIDLHSHILPGLDDGSPDLETSLGMARLAVAEGISTMVATPHVNSTYPLDAATIGVAVGSLNAELVRAEIPLAVLPGAEIATPEMSDLADEDLRPLCLAGGSCVLVESPYAGGATFLDEILFDLDVRGFRPLLAHPERSPTFQRDPDKLARLVERGVLACVNAGSLAGRFGTSAKRSAIKLARLGLVHAVASDAHDLGRRRPGLLWAFEVDDPDVRELAEHVAWFTHEAPAAILSGRPLGSPPRLRASKQSGWRRLIGRGG